MDARNRLLKEVNTAIKAVECSMLIDFAIIIIRAREIQIEAKMNIFDIHSFTYYIKYVIVHSYAGIIMIVLGLALFILLIKKIDFSRGPKYPE